jgi:predicted membrane channel-forming protein YqfA (hemolysin III family)
VKRWSEVHNTFILGKLSVTALYFLVLSGILYGFLSMIYRMHKPRKNKIYNSGKEKQFKTK